MASMQTSTEDRKARAHELLAARARRVAMLRRRVVAGALASFVLAWGTIATTGSLGAGATTTAASSVKAAATVSNGSTTSDTPPSSSTATDTQTQPPAAVTTSQS
jgi:hypothetical protein